MQVEYDILVVAQEDMLAMAAGNLDATPASGNQYLPAIVSDLAGKRTGGR